MRSLIAAAVAAQLTFSHALPKLGPQVTAQVVDVTYAPGASSTPHSHPCPVVVYVVSGALRSQVRGEAPRTYGPGSSFYEAPNGVHQVSANASRTQPAHFIAFFVCDNTAPLSKKVQ